MLSLLLVVRVTEKKTFFFRAYEQGCAARTVTALEDGHLFLFSHFFCSQAYGLAGGGFRELFELYAFAVHILILICLCISGYHSGYIGRLILMKRHLSKTFKYLLLLVLHSLWFVDSIWF